MGWENSQTHVTFYRELGWLSVGGSGVLSEDGGSLPYCHPCEEVAFPSGHAASKFSSPPLLGPVRSRPLVLKAAKCEMEGGLCPEWVFL